MRGSSSKAFTFENFIKEKGSGMNEFESIDAVVHNTFFSNQFTVATIRSSLELIDGPMISFYATFPWGTDGIGKIVILTATSVIESEIELPSGWDFSGSKVDTTKMIIESTRVPTKSVEGLVLKTSLSYWAADPRDRHLTGVSLSAITSTNDQIEIMIPCKPSLDNPKQNLEEVLEVFKN